MDDLTGLFGTEKLTPSEIRFKDLQYKYKLLFGENANGRDVLHDLLRIAGFFSTGFDSDSHKMAYQEGKRTIALHILAMMRVDEDYVLNLLKEKNTNDRDNHNRDDKHSTSTSDSPDQRDTSPEPDITA